VLRRALLQRERVLDPVAVDAAATTQQCSPTCTPSTISATGSSPVRSAASSAASAVSVAATNFRETADLLVADAVALTCSPTGSRPTGQRRVDSPASIRSIALAPRISVPLNSS
jgi:hypothetical protein